MPAAAATPADQEATAPEVGGFGTEWCITESCFAFIRVCHPDLLIVDYRLGSSGSSLDSSVRSRTDGAGETARDAAPGSASGSVR